MTESSDYVIDYDAVRAAVLSKYDAWATVYAEIEAKARESQHELEVRRTSLQELLVAVLYARTLSNVASAILVLERGYDVQSRILLRAAMESLFSLVAIAKDSDQAQTLVSADQLERRRMLHKSRSWSSSGLKAQAAEHATEEKLSEIEAAIEGHASRRISTESMARAAGLHDWYLTAYAIFIASVHSNIRDVERHLILSEDREIEGIRNEPVLENLDKLYLTEAEILLKGLEALEIAFELDSENFRAQKETRLNELGAER